MKPIIYIDQQITKSIGKAIAIQDYVNKNKNLSKTKLRTMLKELFHHLNEARNEFPEEVEDYRTEEEKNRPPIFNMDEL